MVQNNEHMFEKSNLTPLTVKVLTYLSRSPNKRYYVREIARLTQNSLGGCHRVLKELLNMGLVEMERSGRNQYYKTKIGNPAITHFKIFMNIQELNGVLRNIEDISKKIVLFGSCAMGEDTLDSDIDVLVITEMVDDVKELLNGASVGGRKIKTIILAPHGFVNLKRNDPSFYAEVHKGIILWRDWNGEFEKCIEERRLIRIDASAEMIRKELDGGKYDLMRAKESLRNEDYKWASVKAYYSMFHAAKALVLKKGFRGKSHNCLLIAFRELYVRTNEMDPEFADNLEMGMDLRHEADYGLTYADESAEIAVEHAEEFLAITQSVLKSTET